MRRPSRSVATSLLAISLWAIAPVAAFAADPVASEPVRAASGNDEVIANVNGKPIKLSDVALADEEMGSALAQLPEEKRFQYLLSMLIDRRIVADAARAKKMEDDPMVKAREAYFEEKVLRDVYWLQLMRDKVDNKSVKAYYDEHIAKAEAESEVHAAHILVASKLEADKIEATIKGGKSFEDVAKAESKDTSAANGGDLGWFKKEEMVPEFGNAVFAMKVGEVSAPVETQFGWHVIKLIEKRAAPKPTLQQSEEQIMRKLIGDEGNKLMEGLRKSAKIEIVGAEGVPVQTKMEPAPQ
ncbi:MAG: peptidylprolyl isomerase [Parvibaculum sp.]|nr:peptidylprolyl isomerase [Parvibaculum sp.]